MFLHSQEQPFPKCLTYNNVLAWLDHLASTPLPGRPGKRREASTLNSHLKSLKRLARWGVARGHLKKNPIEKLHGKTESDRVILAPELKDVRNILAAAEEQGRTPQVAARNAALLSMLIDFGPRASELVRMDVSDLWLPPEKIVALDRKDVADGKVPGYVVVHGKRSQDRLDAITPKMMLALMDYLPLRRPAPGESALWVTDEGRRMRYAGLRSMLERACRRAGAHIALHDLRRYSATEAWRLGLNVVSAMKIYGHRRETTFMRYIRGAIVERALEDQRKYSPLELVKGVSG